MIPPPVQGRHIPLGKSITIDPDLKKNTSRNQMSKRVIDFAVRLEGTIRSHGVHAAGVVIAPDDIVKFVPLEMAQRCRRHPIPDGPHRRSRLCSKWIF